MKMATIKLYPKYEIDKKGVVRNIKTKKIKKQIYDKGGYKRVMLYDENNIIHNLPVHRLVALTYLQPVANKKYVNHKNGVKNDNRVDNLEWCTIAENNYHKREVLGKQNGSLKKRVRCVETGEIFKSIREATIAKRLNKGDISHVINQSCNHKTAGGLHWELIKGA